MDKFEQAAIERLGSETSLDAISQTMANAKDKSEKVYRAAFRRLVEVSARDEDDPVSRACWEMVHTIGQIRKDNGRRVWRMNRLRPKIEADGPKSALEYCAVNRTDGFDEVLSYGVPEFTAEAIVLSMPEVFDDPKTREIASERLIEAGIDPAKFAAARSEQTT